MMMEQLKEEAKTFNPVKSLIAVVIIIAATAVFNFAFIPTGMEHFGIYSVIPALFLIVYIFITKRILEALTLASVMGFMIVETSGSMGLTYVKSVMGSFSDSLLGVLMSEDIAWLFIVCGLMGSIITLIEKAGGAFAFGEWVSTKAKTRKSTLIWTWLLGVVIFIDDYLNSLTVGSCMAKITDKHKVPREFLSYVVDSTAAPLCVLVPITTWAVFAGKLLETNGWAPEGQAFDYFIKTIPFNFYGWIAALIVPLVIIGIIPIFGPMKKAEKRVAEGGPLSPPGSEKIDIRSGVEQEIPDNPKIYNFILPILVLILATLFFDKDMQMGVLTTIAFMFIFYLAQKIMTAMDFADIAIQGIKNMILPLMLMVLAFLFAEVNDQIGFTAYIINSATSIMTPQLMPFIIFLVLAATEFITGTNWGMYIIAFPIVIPLAQNLGVDMPLAVAAVLSAGVFGSHICFYSDATILTSAACGCDNFRHAITQAPFGILAAILSAILYLVFGFVLA